MIPPEKPEKTTSNKVDTVTQVATEQITTVKETNEITVHPTVDGQQKTGCKQGEYLPNAYCNKVCIIQMYINLKIFVFF